MSKIIHYDFLDRHTNPPERINPSQKYAGYDHLLKYSIDTTTGAYKKILDRTSDHLINAIHKIDKSFNGIGLQYFPLKYPYFGPGMIRIGITQFDRVPGLHKNMMSTYGVSFGRFYGGDLWLNQTLLTYYGRIDIIVKSATDQIKHFLSDLPQGQHPVKNGRSRTFYPFGRSSVWKGRFYFNKREILPFHPRRVKSRRFGNTIAPGGRSYLIRSYTGNLADSLKKHLP